MITSYRELIVWQKAIALVVEIYRLTSLFPKNELYGLTSQMRRAAVSIPSNIAEGFLRKHRQEYIQFLRISFGSGAELETQIEICKQTKLIKIEEFSKSDILLSEVMKMINKFINSLVAKH